MKRNAFLLVFILYSFPLIAASTPQEELQREVQRLQQQTRTLQIQLQRVQKQLVQQRATKKIAGPAIKKKEAGKAPKQTKAHDSDYHKSTLSVQLPDNDPESDRKSVV